MLKYTRSKNQKAGKRLFLEFLGNFWGVFEKMNRFPAFAIIIVLFGALLFAGCASAPQAQATPAPTATFAATPVPTAAKIPVPTIAPTQAPQATATPQASSTPSILEVKTGVEREVNALFPESKFSLIALTYSASGVNIQERTYYEKEVSFSTTAPSGVSYPVRLSIRLQTIYPGEPFDKGYSSVASATVSGRQMDYEEGIVDTKSSIKCYNSAYGVTFTLSNKAKIWDSQTGAWKDVGIKDLYAALAKACPA